MSEATATPAAAPPAFKLDTQAGLYPIVYVRGFAGTAQAREDTFYDTYYGYGETAVEKRSAAPPQFLEPIVFEGQLIRFLKEYGYVDAANGGLQLALSNPLGVRQNPSRSIWISRFYDRDVMFEQVRPIEEHAEDLRKLVCDEIPRELEAAGVDLGPNRQDYRVILIAHSMGGLVCRCLIQNILPSRAPKEDPKRWIHRLVTIGTPHGGIELSAVPDFLEELMAGRANVIGSAIFKEDRMRQYLKLDKKDAGGKLPDVRSLGGRYPEGRCLCIIGSDHESYNVVKKATGSHSDGLVKQSRAYIQGAYWANIHRAHSGRRGIVNSFETYENIRRFLYGDTRVSLWLEDVGLKLAAPEASKKIKEFYDFEFSLSIRGTGIFLHQRKQNPCENAMRFEREKFPVQKMSLHTSFLDTKLRTDRQPFSHFLLAFRVAQHRVRDGFLFDHHYPERTIYSESLEVRVDLGTATKPAQMQFRWLSETIEPDDEKSWTTANIDADGVYRLDLRAAETLSGKLCIKPGPWPDATTNQAGINASA